MALRRAGVVNEIVGAGRNEVNLKKAIELDVIDRYSLNFAEEVSGSDVIVVATPVLAMNSIFEMIAASDYRDTIITDVGSVKKQILQFAEMTFRFRLTPDSYQHTRLLVQNIQE